MRFVRPRPLPARLLVTTGLFLAAAACSSTPSAPASTTAADPAGPVLAGMYTTTDSGPFSSVTFYDDSTYSAHLTACDSEDSCFDHGSVVVSADRTTCTLTSVVSAKVTVLPLAIGATSTAETTDVSQAYSEYADVGDLVSGGGGLVNGSSSASSGSVVQSAKLGSQSFVAGAPQSGTSASACPRSARGQSIEAAVRSKHAAWENVTWGVACGGYPGLVNWPTVVTPVRSTTGKDSDFKSPDACTAGSSGCDPDFLRKRCTQQSDCRTGTCSPLAASVSTPGGAPQSMCLGDDDYVYDTIYSVVAHAQRHVEVSGLLLWIGGYEAALRNALTYLNTTAPSDHVIPVHIIGGLEIPFPQSKVDASLKSFTRDLGPSPKIQVSVGTFGGPPLAWNHSKIVEADGTIALVGGNHWRDEDYNYGAPVHDTSALYTGDVAKLAQRYHNYIWDYSKAHGSTATLKSTLPAAAAAGDNDDTDAGILGSGGGGLLSSVPFIGVGTTGGLPFNGYRDSSGDDGIYALIGTAQKTVRITQQDMASNIGLKAVTGIPVTPGVITALAAAITRGVDVTVIISGAIWTNGWSIAETGQALGDALIAQGVPASTLCTKFHFGSARDAAGALVGQHAKLVIADESAFYMGSQNLYPGGMAGTYVTQLAEFGFIVDDPSATQSLLTRYWAPLYGDSSPLFISGTEARSCIFAAGATPAADCSTGWLKCPSGGTCAWNGAGYCCKALGHSASGAACVSDSDGACAASSSGGICSIAATAPSYEFWKGATHTCTTPDAQRCE